MFIFRAILLLQGRVDVLGFLRISLSDLLWEDIISRAYLACCGHREEQLCCGQFVFLAYAFVYSWVVLM